jgi:hypothetical protein
MRNARHARHAPGASQCFTKSAPARPATRTVRAWRDRRPSPLATAARQARASSDASFRPRHPPETQSSTTPLVSAGATRP